MDEEERPVEPLVYAQTVRGSKRGMAVTALVFGILGFFCPLLGVVGVVLGIIVLASRDSPGVDRGKGLAIGGLCCGAIGTLFSLVTVPLLISILLPSLARARELSKRTVCATNMKAAGMALNIYAQDHDGLYPPSLDYLVDAGSIVSATLTCPSSELPAGLPHYDYVAGLTGDCDPRQIILYEDPSNHGAEGSNVLYCDGTVSFEDAAQWQRILKDGGVPDP